MACRRAPAPPPSPAVATFTGGAVTAADVDQAVLDLPPQRRQPEDGDLLAWYERIAREIAVQRLLLVEARQAGLDKDPEVVRAGAEVRKQATVDVFLEKDVARPGRPSEAELRAFYDDHRAEFEARPARLAQHIFRRVDPGGDRAAARAAVAALRARVLAGEEFSALAAEHSDSESRHQKGVLGWVTRGQLAPDLERILFSLEVGVPSEPIATREGVHLFLVSQERPKATYSFPEVRALILRRLTAERWDKSVRDKVGDSLPEGAFVAGGDELRQILAAGDPQALVARVGDFRLTVAELQRRLAAAGALDPATRAVPPAAFLAQLRQREVIYRHCAEHGLDRRPEVEARRQRLLDRELAALLLRRKLVQAVEREPAVLEEHYRTNRARFSEPLELRVQKLVIPLAGAANETMARLEGSVGPLDQGRQSLASLAAALGGRVEEQDWATPSQIARTDPRAAGFVMRLRPGRHSPPYRTEKDIVMVRLVERKEPRPLPFDQARERVRDDYLATHRQERYAALSADLLGRAGFKLVQGNLEALLRRAGAEGT
jgi:peptidyl-prolyl cis-trans isomerase C